MPRIKVTSFVKNLFSHVPLELGLTDAEVVASTPLKAAHKTFSRYRNDPPKSIASEHLLAIARLVPEQWKFDAAHVLAAVRKGPDSSIDTLNLAMRANTIKTSSKDLMEIDRLTLAMARSARRICIFDRFDSFEYLRPEEDQDASEEPDATPPVDPAECDWSQCEKLLRYDRHPRIFAVLTAGSIAARASVLGDEGIEHLIGSVQAGHNSVTVINDALAIAHRVFRGIFEDAAAVAIFDDTFALVWPIHHRTLRTYDARHDACHAMIIRGAIGAFARMRRFRLHSPITNDVVSLLEGYLSYHAARQIADHQLAAPMLARRCA